MEYTVRRTFKISSGCFWVRSQYYNEILHQSFQIVTEDKESGSPFVLLSLVLPGRNQKHRPPRFTTENDIVIRLIIDSSTIETMSVNYVQLLIFK